VSTTLLTSDEAAARLRVCPKILRRLRKAGCIRYVALGERRIMYRMEDCDEYIASRVRKDEPCQTPAPRQKMRQQRGPGVIIPFSERKKGTACHDNL
jgi:hypothetical protein